MCEKSTASGGLPEWKRALLQQICRSEPALRSEIDPTNPTQLYPFPERKSKIPPSPDPFAGSETVEEEPFDLNACVRELCLILSDPVTTEEEKYSALTTIGDALFPDRPIFRDITDASAWPPSPEEIDAVVAAFHQAANNCMSDEGAEPFQAARACIEWALGRLSTGYIPHFVSSIIVDVTGVMPGEE
jgi:hypothetical protein